MDSLEIAFDQRRSRVFPKDNNICVEKRTCMKWVLPLLNEEL